MKLQFSILIAVSILGLFAFPTLTASADLNSQARWVSDSQFVIAQADEGNIAALKADIAADRAKIKQEEAEMAKEEAAAKAKGKALPEVEDLKAAIAHLREARQLLRKAVPASLRGADKTAYEAQRESAVKKTNGAVLDTYKAARMYIHFVTGAR